MWNNMCMAMHNRLHIADAEVSDLARRLSELVGKSKTESLRDVLREKVHSLERQRTAAERQRAILQIIDQKLPAPAVALTKKEIEEMLGL
jgi:hypothetical protein